MAVNPQGSSMQKRPRTHVSLLQSAGPFVRKQLFLSLLLMGVKSDKTMLSEVTFTLVIGMREAIAGSTFIYHSC